MQTWPRARWTSRCTSLCANTAGYRPRWLTLVQRSNCVDCWRGRFKLTPPRTSAGALHNSRRRHRARVLPRRPRLDFRLPTAWAAAGRRAAAAAWSGLAPSVSATLAARRCTLSRCPALCRGKRLQRRAPLRAWPVAVRRVPSTWSAPACVSFWAGCAAAQTPARRAAACFG